MPRSTRQPVAGPAAHDRRTSARYLFADCLLDTRLYALHRAGLAVPLRPKAFHALRYLLEHRDRLVTKDELCAHVWPAEFISDATIESCIKRVREAIGDTGRAQALIQTRRGYGYRFVGAVEERLEAADAPGSAETSPPSPDVRPPREAEGGPELAPASPGRGAPRGERKLVTLLGCAPAHVASSVAGADLDALHGQMRTLYALTRREVERFGGTIHSIVGTRVLAVFGAPLAQEDHPRRALLAALALQRRLATPSGEAADLPAACLSLHTGAVVMGGIGQAQESAIVGDLTLAVEALQGHGVAGALLCSEATARVVRHDANLEEVAPVVVAGQPSPMRTYKVMGLAPEDASVPQTAPRALTPFVGRAHELAALRAILARVVDGRGQIVGIVGEPGIGKSRLLAEFRRRLEASGRVCYLEGHCLSYGGATPYLPVQELLRAHCGVTRADTDDAISAKVLARVRALGLAPETAVPYLSHLLGVKVPAVEVAGGSAERLKSRTFAALRQLWLTSSQPEPLIVAVEDLHWSDPTSVEFLASLVDALPGAALLVLVTYRPGFRPPWAGKSYATQLTVPPLSARDSMQVVRAVLEREPAPFADALLARAQGNPFFLEELARTVGERSLAPDAPGGGVALRRSPAVLELPATVEALLLARIDRLSPDAKHLLQTAAVIGMDVPMPLLQRIAEVPEATLHRGLADLQGAEFIHEGPRSPGRYSFKHTLTQEVAYNGLLRESRRIVHERIVDALETLTGATEADRWLDSDRVDRLAHHAVQGEAWAKALVYCRQAGEKAMARSAHREAAAYFEQAILALPHLPQTRPTREEAVDLRLALRSALHPCGDIQRAMVCVREAEGLAAALDDRRRLGEASVSLSLHAYLVGAYDHAVASAQRALALAEAAGEGVPRLLASLHLGIAYQAQGAYGKAIGCLLRAAAPVAGLHGHQRFGELIPAVFSPAYVAACHAELGTFADGRSIGDAGLRTAEALDHPASLAFASWGVGMLALRQGDLSRAMSVLERAADSPRDTDRPAWFPLMASALGATYTRAGRIDDARQLLMQALEQTMATEVVVNQAVCTLTLAEAQLAARELDEAHRLATDALSCARERKERGVEAYTLHLLGEIAMRRQPRKPAEAEGHCEQALGLADGLGMRPLQAHCHHFLGNLAAKAGRRKRARYELSTAIDAYRRMEMVLWLPHAEASLARLV